MHVNDLHRCSVGATNRAGSAAEYRLWRETGVAWQTLMHGVARLMKALATRCNVAVVCTTHTVGGAQVMSLPVSLAHCDVAVCAAVRSQCMQHMCTAGFGLMPCTWTHGHAGDDLLVA